MKKAHLMQPLQLKRSQFERVWVSEFVPDPEQFFEHLEMDIKYIWVHGEKRHIFKLTLLDVRSRLNMAELVQESIKKKDVVGLLNYVKQHYSLPQTIYIRNDNGSQFVSDLVRKWMSENEVNQEFTRPATPQQNGHIEAYHSIVERCICRRIELTSVEHAYEVFNRFHYFYNYKRIHSGIDNYSPMKYLQLHGFDPDKINNDFYLRGWRLETTANK